MNRNQRARGDGSRCILGLSCWGETGQRRVGVGVSVFNRESCKWFMCDSSGGCPARWHRVGSRYQLKYRLMMFYVKKCRHEWEVEKLSCWTSWKFYSSKSLFLSLFRTVNVSVSVTNGPNSSSQGAVRVKSMWSCFSWSSSKWSLVREHKQARQLLRWSRVFPQSARCKGGWLWWWFPSCLHCVP